MQKATWIIQVAFCDVGAHTFTTKVCNIKSCGV